MSDLLNLTSDERAIITARRELAAAAEKKRIEEDAPIDLDDIKPGMSRADEEKAVRQIREAWGRAK